MKRNILLFALSIIMTLSFGQTQNGLEFDGNNDYITISNNQAFAAANSDFTISLWVKSTDVVTSINMAFIGNYHYSGGQDPFFMLGYDEVNAWFWIRDINDNDIMASTPVSNVLDGAWHHLAGVRSAGTIYLYLDGVLVGTDSSLPGDLRYNNTIYLMDHYERYTQGSIDEVRIWDVSLTQSEIRDNMYREIPSPTTESNLVAYYQFNETTGTNLPDESANSNNGTLVNMTNADWVASTAPIPYYSVQNGNWNTDATWASGQNAPVNDWARVIINDDVTVTTAEVAEDLTIESGASLTINPDHSLTVDGSLVNNQGNDGLIVKADATGMGSLIMSSPSVGATVETYITEDQWHYVASPVMNAKSGVFTSIYLIEWSEPDSTWTYIVPTNYDLDMGIGYGAWPSSSLTGTTTVEWQGNLASVSPTIPLTFNDNSGEGHGWNLIGNPYPSAVEWNANWTSSNVDATMYVYDGGAGNYLTWNYNLNTGTKGNGVIPVAQGFFVKANAASPDIHIPLTERLHHNEDFYKSQQNNLLNISVNGKQMNDKAILHFNDMAAQGFDSDFDAYKIFGDADAPQLYFPVPQNDLAVNVLPFSGNNMTIPLNFTAGTNGLFTLNFEGIETFEAFDRIYLEDKKNLTITDLNKAGQYNFAGSVEDNADRFVLHFGANAPGIGISSQSQQTFDIYSAGSSIYLDLTNAKLEKTDVQVFNLAGQQVFSETVISNTLVNIPVDMAEGTYVVRAVNGSKLVTSKVMIQ